MAARPDRLPADARTMTFACRIDDVPLGEGREISVAGRRVAIFRTTRAWYALDATCPHRGGPLADGLICDRSVICPLHERRFDLVTGAPLVAGDPVAAHAVEVRGDGIYVALGDGSI
ncbi:MAG TPA: Rieske 2Fe-2S domain-containing protein [Baekduia sp.]|nr:Rieske 2Fe-2S domain-containing protein [Baekduia sp.]